jgi:hypothetical protein
LLQKLVDGGLKLRTGNVCVNDGVLVDVALNMPLLAGSG